MVKRGRPTAEVREELFQRRWTVARLHARRVPRMEIARQLGQALRTIDRDLGWLSRGWRSELVSDLAAIKERELGELDAMERQAAERFETTHDGRWLSLRLQVKEHRARLLGLFAPQRLDVLISREEAERIGAEFGLDPTEVLREAEAVLKERRGR